MRLRALNLFPASVCLFALAHPLFSSLTWKLKMDAEKFDRLMQGDNIGACAHRLLCTLLVGLARMPTTAPASI